MQKTYPQWFPGIKSLLADRKVKRHKCSQMKSNLLFSLVFPTAFICTIQAIIIIAKDCFHKYRIPFYLFFSVRTATSHAPNIAHSVAFSDCFNDQVQAFRYTMTFYFKEWQWKLHCFLLMVWYLDAWRTVAFPVATGLSMLWEVVKKVLKSLM